MCCDGRRRGRGGYRSSRVGGIRELTSSQVESRQDRDGLWQSATCHLVGSQRLPIRASRGGEAVSRALHGQMVVTGRLTTRALELGVDEGV